MDDKVILLISVVLIVAFALIIYLMFYKNKSKAPIEPIIVRVEIVRTSFMGRGIPTLICIANGDRLKLTYNSNTPTEMRKDYFDYLAGTTGTLTYYNDGKYNIVLNYVPG